MAAATNRQLHWDGCCNVRDLGGLVAAGGRRTRRGTLVRSDAVDRLSAEGWAALWAYGVRTIVDLRNEDERGADRAPRPAGLETIWLPLDAIEQRDFWDEWASGPQFGTPLYYRPHLERFPQRSARVLAAVARARPGGVLFHCVGGRDRAGQIALLLLALAGVEVDEIAADYALSSADPAVDEYLRERGISTAAAIASTLTGLDVEAHLRPHGLTAADVAALRARLLGDEFSRPLQS